MTVLLFFIFSCDASYNDRREWILVFETHVVFSYDGESLEEIFTVDSYSIFLSFHGSSYANATCSYFCISSGYLDNSFMSRTYTCIVIILTRYEICLFECIDKFGTHDCGFCLEFSWEKSLVFRKFTRKKSRCESD